MPIKPPQRFRFPSIHHLLLWGLRILVVAVLLLLLALGLRDVIHNIITSNSSNPGNGSSSNDFPKAAAEVFATRFALAYATFDSDHPTDHQNALRPYLASDTDPMLGWDGQGKETANHALPWGVDIQSRQQATVRVAVGVDNGRWIYLGVPVTSNGNNQLLITGAPALLSPPTPGVAPPPPSSSDDPTLGTQLRAPMSDFFSAYAASSPSQLNYYAVPGKSFEGLHGSVNFGDLPELHISQEGGDQRQARALVRWFDPTSKASLTQSYQLTLQLVGGQWHVSSIAPAGP